MIAHPALHRIRIGDATPDEAREAIRDILLSDAEDATLAVYTALRSWTWKAMQSRQFGDELVEWFRVIRASGAAISDRDERTAHHLEALSHLVEDSVRYASVRSDTLLMSRRHVADILCTVQRLNGRAGRSQLAEALELSSSRLSQLTTDLQIAGTLDRESSGRGAIFLLTDRGRALLDAWAHARSAATRRQAEANERASKKTGVVAATDTGQNHAPDPAAMTPDMPSISILWNQARVSSPNLTRYLPALTGGPADATMVKMGYVYADEIMERRTELPHRLFRLNSGQDGMDMKFDIPALAFTHNEKELVCNG